MQKYTNKKRRTQPVLKLIEKHVTDKMYERMRVCYNWTKNVADKTEEKFKVIDAFGCSNRFCPMCAWVKSNKDAEMLSVMMDYMKDEQKCDYLVLTLTMPNVEGEKLAWAIDKINNAFKKLYERKDVKNMCLGYARKLEVTYNGEKKITRDMWFGNGRHKGRSMMSYMKRRGLKIGDPNPNYDTYHPHFHVIIAVSRGYVHGGKYVEQRRWLEMWREAMEDESITQVDIRKMYKPRNKPNGDVREVAKYAAKDADYTGLQVKEVKNGVVTFKNLVKAQEVFDFFYYALKGRQYLTFNGCFKDARKKYKAGELDEYKKIDDTDYHWLLEYGWGGDVYAEKSRRELTDLEKMGMFGLPAFTVTDDTETPWDNEEDETDAAQVEHVTAQEEYLPEIPFVPENFDQLSLAPEYVPLVPHHVSAPTSQDEPVPVVQTSQDEPAPVVQASQNEPASAVLCKAENIGQPSLQAQHLPHMPLRIPIPTSQRFEVLPVVLNLSLGFNAFPEKLLRPRYVVSETAKHLSKRMECIKTLHVQYRIIRLRN